MKLTFSFALTVLLLVNSVMVGFAAESPEALPPSATAPSAPQPLELPPLPSLPEPVRMPLRGEEDKKPDTTSANNTPSQVPAKPSPASGENLFDRAVADGYLMGDYTDPQKWLTPPDGFVWPTPVIGSLPLESSFEKQADDKLPAGFRPIVQKWITENNADAASEGDEEMRVDPSDIWLYDLNADGVPEVFVFNKQSSGRGGRCFDIYQVEKGELNRICLIAGEPIFHRSENGWLQIETKWRFGGANFARSLIRYENGKYWYVRDEDHEFLKRTVGVNTKKRLAD